LAGYGGALAHTYQFLDQLAVFTTYNNQRRAELSRRLILNQMLDKAPAEPWKTTSRPAKDRWCQEEEHLPSGFFAHLPRFLSPAATAQADLNLAMQLCGVLFGLPRQIDDVNLLLGPGDGAAITRPPATPDAVMGCANYFPSFVSNDSYLHNRLPLVLFAQTKAFIGEVVDR
jgi:hypothetical protein